MEGILILCLALLTLSATAEDLQRVYQTDAYGRIRHDKPSYSVGKTGGSWRSTRTGTNSCPEWRSNEDQ
jgi:hypothetical protein